MKFPEQVSFLVTVKWDDATNESETIVQATEQKLPFNAVHVAAANLMAAAGEMSPLGFDNEMTALVSKAKSMRGTLVTGKMQ